MKSSAPSPSRALVYIFLLPLVFDRLIGLADGLKIAISLALIAPLAFCMGMPFPLGLRQLAGSTPAGCIEAGNANGHDPQLEYGDAAGQERCFYARRNIQIESVHTSPVL